MQLFHTQHRKPGEITGGNLAAVFLTTESFTPQTPNIFILLLSTNPVLHDAVTDVLIESKIFKHLSHRGIKCTDKMA